jgi:D-3-phosphoglycerate dehydrogenase
MTSKVLIATRSFGSTSPKPVEILHKGGCDLVNADMSLEMTEERLIDLLKGVAAAIVGVVPMTAYVLEHAPDLKVVSAHGVGVDHIDLDAAARLGITIANCPGANAASVSDLTIGLMIAIARNVPGVERKLRQGGWGRHHGSELFQKTLGIIGLGHIGSGVAKRAMGFDMKVLVHDPYVPSVPKKLPEMQLVSFENIIRLADFVSLHAPLNDDTRNLIGPAELATMKPGAYLINTARGGLVDEQALFDALNTGKIAGAAFDCFVDEPPTSSPLLELDNFVGTPHIGAHTQESIERMGVMAAQNVINALKGQEPLNRVR